MQGSWPGQAPLCSVAQSELARSSGEAVHLTFARRWAQVPAVLLTVCATLDRASTGSLNLRPLLCDMEGMTAHFLELLGV